MTKAAVNGAANGAARKIKKLKSAELFRIWAALKDRREEFASRRLSRASLARVLSAEFGFEITKTNINRVLREAEVEPWDGLNSRYCSGSHRNRPSRHVVKLQEDVAAHSDELAALRREVRELKDWRALMETV